MSIGKVSEKEINLQIRDIFCKKNPDWDIPTERTRTVVGEKGRAPDIIIKTNEGGVVIIETEFSPASGLTGDVQSRLNVELEKIGKPDAIMGVILPTNLENIDERDTKLMYYVMYTEPSSHQTSQRFPTRGYLEGTLYDLMTAVRQVSVPLDKINKCIELMQYSIAKISHTLQTELNTKTQQDIIGYIGQPDSTNEQSLNMAALIILNAGIFHEELVRYRDDVQPLQKIKSVVLDQAAVINAWEKILDIDYAPIFDNAVSILTILPSKTAADVLDEMHQAVSKIIALGVSKSGDVYGALYQNMLGSDRKKAAAFYTRPEAATLLAGLVMPSVSDPTWKDPKKLESMRIADFACGTGMLLTAAVRHVMNNSDTYDHTTHKHMLEEQVYGFDILPTATHLTASNLSGLVPQAVCDDMRIYQMPIGMMGKRERDNPNLGSLDLIKSNAKFTVAGYRHSGKHGLDDTRAATIEDCSCDFILMNPPYVRSTTHDRTHTDSKSPFAVCGIPAETRLKMEFHSKKLFKHTCADGNAGFASYFLAIMNRALSAGGGFGIVLPATAAAGNSWSKVRSMLSRYYEELMVVFIGVGSGGEGIKQRATKTYSSDTAINEILVIGRKIHASKKIPAKDATSRIILVLLDRLPHTNLEAQEIARSIRNETPNSLETDMGDTSIRLGETIVGRIFNCPAKGDRWWVGRVSDTRLLSYVYNLAHGNINNIPISTLIQYAEMGKHHRDIWETNPDGTPRGPFNKIPLYDTAKYKALWKNDSLTQRCMTVGPTLALEKKHNATPEHAQNVLNTATHTYLNAQVGYGAQRIIAAYTKEKHVGGSAWYNIILQNPAYEKTFVVWFNSIFGILTYWTYAGDQQQGRGRMSKTQFRILPILDFVKLTKKQIKDFDRLFDETCNETLLSISHLDEDPVRQKIDRGILKILGVECDDLNWLYRQIVEEPQFGRIKKQNTTQEKKK